MPPYSPSDEPQWLIQGSLRQQYFGIPFSPGASDNEYALMQRAAQITQLGDTNAALERIEDRLGERASSSSLRGAAADVAGAVVEVLMPEAYRIFGAGGGAELQRLASDAVQRLSRIGADVVDTRELLGSLIRETNEELTELRGVVVDTREQITGALRGIEARIEETAALLHEDLEGIHRTLRAPMRTRADECVQAAEQYMTQRRPDFRKAQRELQQALLDYRRHARAHLLSGFTHVGLGDPEAARDAFREAIDAQDDPLQASEACLAAARLEIASGNMPAAEAMLREALEISLEDPEAHFQLAILLESRGDRDGAQSQLFQAIAINPHYDDRAKRVVELQRLVAQRRYYGYYLVENMALSIQGAMHLAAWQYATGFHRQGDYMLTRVKDHPKLKEHIQALLEMAMHSDAPELMQCIDSSLSHPNFGIYLGSMTVSLEMIDRLLRNGVWSSGNLVGCYICNGDRIQNSIRLLQAYPDNQVVLFEIYRLVSGCSENFALLEEMVRFGFVSQAAWIVEQKRKYCTNMFGDTFYDYVIKLSRHQSIKGLINMMSTDAF